MEGPSPAPGGRTTAARMLAGWDVLVALELALRPKAVLSLRGTLFLFCCPPSAVGASVLVCARKGASRSTHFRAGRGRTVGTVSSLTLVVLTAGTLFSASGHLAGVQGYFMVGRFPSRWAPLRRRATGSA